LHFHPFSLKKKEINKRNLGYFGHFNKQKSVILKGVETWNNADIANFLL